MLADSVDDGKAGIGSKIGPVEGACARQAPRAAPRPAPRRASGLREARKDTRIEETRINSV